MPVGFIFSKIVILQSLDPIEDFQSGSYLHEFLIKEIIKNGLTLVVELYDCETMVDYRRVIDQLILEAKTTGEVPLLHVECHGNSDGICFNNGSDLSWSEIREQLVELNVACGFNLATVFLSCFGGYFLKELSAIKPAPCLFLISPTETIFPDEGLTAFKEFYSYLLISRDIGKAIEVISQMRLSKGYWIGKSAELWFQDQVNRYIDTFCLKKHSRERVHALWRQAKTWRSDISIGEVKVILKKENRVNISQKFFDIFLLLSESLSTSGAFMKRTKKSTID
jgi:hypothetical protein